MSHYAISVFSSARRQAISLSQSWKDEWRMLEHVRGQRRKEKEVAEKAGKIGGRVEGRLVTINEEDGDLSM